MKLKDLSKEELERLQYDDIAFSILTSYGKKMKIQTLFNKICELLGLSEKDFEEKIADFFELLSTDKRFIMLPNGYWDLRSNHSRKIEIDDDDEDLIIETEESDSDEDLFLDGEEDDDDVEDEFKDLVVIDPDEEDIGIL
jgi:DNA-directed RNA polymerase subunit delta